MRGRIMIVVVAVAVAALTGVGSDATAGPVNAYDNGSSFEQTCLSWNDYEGAEQGWIELCGQVSSYAYDGNTHDWRWVRAERSVQTCDDQGNNCSDAYSEIYSGPADASEFSMDITTGTASFNIALAGETPDQQCTVNATATASGTYSSSDPYPRIHAYGNPTSPWIGAEMGSDWVSGYLSPYGASVAQGTNKHVSRAATGSGTVCNWVETLSQGSGGMWSSANTSTTYTVTPTL